MNAVVADVLLQVPVVTDYLCLVNTKAANEKTIDCLLAPGNTVAMYPGGIHEQVRTDEDEARLYFPPNLSFIRLAIKYGVDIVPLYTFGENQLWPTSERSKAFNMKAYQKFGVGNVLLHSPIWNLPTSILLPSPLLMPRYAAPMICKIGDPIKVGPADPEASEDRIFETFEKYVDSLRGLFEEHSFACLPPQVASRGLTTTLRAGKTRGEMFWHSKPGSPPSKL